DRADPVVAAELAEVPRRRAAGIGHEDIDLGRRRQHLGAPFRRGDVARHRDDVHAGLVGDALRGIGEHVGSPAVDDEVNALARERKRATEAQSAARAAHDRPPALDTQIHSCLPLWTAWPPRQRRPLNCLTAALATALEYRAEHAAQYLATEAGAKRTRRALGGRLEDGVGAPGATARPRAATQDPAEGAQHALAPRGLRLGGGP